MDVMEDANRQLDNDAPPAGLRLVDALAVAKAVLCDQALTGAQRTAVGVIVLQANGATGCSWTSYRQLRAATGMGYGQIAGGIKAALGRYLVEQAKGNHGAVCYRILLPASAPAVGAQDAENPPPGATALEALPQSSATELVAPGGAALPKPTRSATNLVAILDYTGETTPLTPQGGESEISSPADAEEEAEPHAHADKAAILEALDTAHEAVFGVPMPNRWRRRVKGMNGSATVFATVTAADVRTAITRAKDQRKPFGFGWVENVMLEKAARDQARRQAQEAKRRAEEGAARRCEQQRQQHEAQQQQAAARLDAFRRLDATARGRFLDAAASRLPFLRRPDVLEHHAALMAWQESQSQEGANA